MLPQQHRLTASNDFQLVSRRGRRRTQQSIVVQALIPHSQCPHGTSIAPPARVGVVVSKKVGSAVARNRVKRRLRAQMVPHLSALKPASLVVLRARHGAASATSAEFSAQLAE